MSESVSWVIFPGEGVDGKGTTVGHVCVVQGGAVAASYEVVHKRGDMAQISQCGDPLPG